MFVKSTCFKQVCQLLLSLIVVIQGTTMFHDLVVSINFWCSLMTRCPLISNPDIFRPHPHVSGYFLNPKLFLCRLKNFHLHTAYSNSICPSTCIRIRSQFVSLFVKGPPAHANFFPPSTSQLRFNLFMAFNLSL